MLYGSLSNAAEETVEPVAQRIATKWSFFTYCFLAKLAPKISTNLYLNYPAKFAFFSQPIGSPVVWCDPSDLFENIADRSR